MLLFTTLNISQWRVLTIDSENPPYIIFNNVDRYIDKSNQDKHLVFASTHKNKKVLKKYTKLRKEIKNKIKTINGVVPTEYKKDFMNIGRESDDHLPLGKLLNISMIIVLHSVLQEDSNYYLQVYLHDCVSYKEYSIFVQ